MFSFLTIKQVRKQLFISIIFALLIQNSGFAGHLVDSLSSELNWYKQNCPKCDSTLVDLLNRLAWESRHINRDTAISFAEDARDRANKSGNKAGEASAYARLGVLYKQGGDYQSAMVFYQKCLEIRRTLNRPLEVAGVYNNIGILLKRLGRLEEARDSSQKALNIAIRLGDSVKVAKFSNNIGSIHKRLGDYKPALKSYHRALRIRIERNDSTGLIHSYNDLGGFYFRLGLYKMAQSYYQKCLDIQASHGSTASVASLHNNLGGVAFELDEFQNALRHYQTCLELRKQINDSNNVPDIVYDIGQVYLSMGFPNKALTHLRQAHSLYKRNGNDIELFHTQHSIGAAYFSLDSLERAYVCFYDAFEFAKKNNQSELLSYCLQDLATLHIKLDEPGLALKYTQEYQLIQDSLKQKKEEVLDIALIERELQKEYMEQLAIERNAEIKEQKAAKQRRNWIIIALAIGTVILLVVGFFFVRWLRQRQEVELTETTESATRSGVVAGQEAERKRIAVDLHDRLGSLLSLIKLQFSSQEGRLVQTEEQHLEYQRARVLIDKAVKEVGQIVWEMEARDLQELGLLPALKNLFTIYRELGLKIDLYHFDLYQRVGFDVEKNLFRIIQEVMNNIVKHANASQVTTQLLVSEGNLNVVIEDDGVGFEPSNAQVNGRFSGNGLKNIQLRVEALNGTIQLDSTPGRGTTIVIDVPVQEV